MKATHKPKPLIILIAAAALFAAVALIVFFSLPRILAKQHTTTTLPEVKKSYQTAEAQLDYPLAAFGITTKNINGTADMSECVTDTQTSTLCYASTTGSKSADSKDAFDAAFDSLQSQLRSHEWHSQIPKTESATIDAAISGLKLYDDNVSYAEFKKTIDGSRCTLNISASKPTQHKVMMDLRCSQVVKL